MQVEFVQGELLENTGTMNSDANPRSPEEETSNFPSSQDSVQRVLKKYLHGSQESEQSTSASTVGMPSSESSLIYHTANRYEVEEGRARDQVEYSINHRVEFRAAHPQAAFPQSQASQQFSPQMYGSVPPPFSPFFAPVPVPHPPTAVRGVTLFGPNGMPNALNEPKHYGFRVVFGEHQSMSKSATQTYSHKLQKWFVNITSRCTLRIQCDVAPPPGSRVRLAMAHKAATMLGDTVLCCALHQHSQSKETGTENAGHFVRSLDQPCSYLSPDPVTSRHCVLVPIDSMQQSSRGSTAPSSPSSPTEYVAILRFPCYTSHLPRQGRSVQLLCGLEVPQLDQFLPVARAVVEVRVSASPGRDRETAETPKPPRGSRGDVSPKSGGSSPVPNDRRKRAPGPLLNTPSQPTSPKPMTTPPHQTTPPDPPLTPPNFGELLKKYKDRILSEVMSTVVSLRLRMEEVISGEVAREIKDKGDKKGNWLIYLHLREQGDLKSLQTFGTVLAEEQGYHKMQRLGRDLLANVTLPHGHHSSPGDAPIEDVAFFLPYLDEMMSQLMVLGALLGLGSFTPPGDSPSDKCISTLQEWLKRTASPTVRKFCQCLEKAPSFNRLRETILRFSSRGSSDVKDIQRIVEGALKNGSVKVKVVKAVLWGPPGVGKTQLKQALLGKFKKVQESTDVSTQAAPAVEVLLADAAHKKWELFEGIHLNTLAMDKDSWSDKQWSISADTRSSESVDSSKVTSSSEAQLKLNSKHYEKINVEIIASITDAEAKSDSKEPLEYKLMYIIDNGGQPSFLDFHSVTATFAASYVHLFDARGKGLAAFPEMTFRKTKSMFQIKDDMPPSIYSNVDLLRRSLLTVHHFKSRFNQRHEKIRALLGKSFQPADSPHVLIVGTHKDSESSERSVREADHKRVHIICESIPSLKQQHDIVFVDSLNQKCKELGDIREALSQEDNLNQFDLPLSWFQVYLLSLSVAKGSDKSLQAQKYDHLEKMCLDQNHVQSPEEFRAMVTVMHCLGVFCAPELDQLDPKDDFSNVLIFLNPNLLFEYLSQIFAIPFCNLSLSSSYHLRTLQDLGELTPKCLGQLGIPDTLVSLPGFHNKLLGWLVNWRLAAKKDGEDKWFIPSVLPPRPKGPPQFVLGRFFENVFPLYLTFFEPKETTRNDCFHYFPAGFFPHLVVHLMQTERFLLYENSKSNDENGYPYRCRDSIRLSTRYALKLKYTLDICLVDESDRLAVYMWPAYQPQPLSSDPSPSPELLNTLYHAGAVLADLKSYMTQTSDTLFCTSIGNVALCSACPCKHPPPQSSSQAVQPAPIHLAKVCCDDREPCLQCLSLNHSGLGQPIRDVDDVSLAKVLRGFSGLAQDSPRTRKRGVGEGSHSEQSPSTTELPQAKRSARDPSRAEQLHRQECTQGPTAPWTGMDEKIGCSLDILEVPEYKDGLIGEMKSLGSVLGIGEDTNAILSTPGTLNTHLLEILGLYIKQKTPTWEDFCKALKRLACFNKVRAKIEADHDK